MTARLRLPTVLSSAAGTARDHVVGGADVAGALADLLEKEPGLRGHVLDERGEIRPHVSVFVGGRRAALDTPVPDGSEIWVIQAVSGGGQVR